MQSETSGRKRRRVAWDDDGSDTQSGDATAAAAPRPLDLRVPSHPDIVCVICMDPAIFPVSFPCADHTACLTCVVEMASSSDVSVRAVPLSKMGKKRGGDGRNRSEAASAREIASGNVAAVRKEALGLLVVPSELRCPVCRDAAPAFQQNLEGLQPLPPYVYDSLLDKEPGPTEPHARAGGDPLPNPCRKPQFTCLYCPERGTARAVTQHLLRHCQHVVFRCCHCRQPYPRCKREHHILEECFRLPCDAPSCEEEQDGDDEDEDEKDDAKDGADDDDDGAEHGTAVVTPTELSRVCATAAHERRPAASGFRGTWKELVEHTRIHDYVSKVTAGLDLLDMHVNVLSFGAMTRDSQRAQWATLVRDVAEFCTLTQNKLQELAASSKRMPLAEYMPGQLSRISQLEQELGDDGDGDEESDDDEDDDDGKDNKDSGDADGKRTEGAAGAATSAGSTGIAAAAAAAASQPAVSRVLFREERGAATSLASLFAASDSDWLPAPTPLFPDSGHGF